MAIQLGDKSASARSPVAIMTLNVRHGERVHVRAAGPDAAAAVDAIIALLDAGEVPEPEPVSVSVAPARALCDNEIAGVCALPGVVLGTATHWRRRMSEAAEQGRGVQEERAALAKAQSGVRAHLQAVAGAAGGAAAAIAQAHIGLLGDEDLNAAAAAEMERGR